jgi:hypothetical protein
LAALNFRIVASVGPENDIIIKSSQDQTSRFFFGRVEAIFPAFAGGATSVMAANLAREISTRQRLYYLPWQAALSTPRYRVKNSKILRRCTRHCRNETGMEQEAKRVDEVTDCLNRTFCHSRAEVLRHAHKPDAPVIGWVHGN